MSLLDDLADDVTAALGGELRAGTYWRADAVGLDESGDPIIEWVGHACEGVRASYDAMYAAQAGIPIDAVRIEIIAATLAVEATQGDAVFIEDAWHAIDEVSIDPAGALYTLRCHGIEDPTT